MSLKRGLWLSLIDEGGEATLVACDVLERNDSHWRLEALVPPQVYPVTFVAARLRLDGHFLGLIRLPEPQTTVTHEPMFLTIDFPVDPTRFAALERAS
ncbi:MAG: hypothetical protein ACK47B_26635 [Armatimonadota bacterium]